MSQISTIEWTESTWNPVTGCTKVSPGCKNCYAETFAERWRGIKGHPYEQGFELRIWPERLGLPLQWKKPRMIFVNSMSDLFQDGVSDKFIASVFDVMTKANHHVFQLLTKRSERFAQWTSDNYSLSNSKAANKPIWPRNVWAGVSVENQDYVYRIKDLQKVPAEVRFLSVEPLLGPIKFSRHLLKGIHWVIVGGESGHGARKMDPDWVRDIQAALAQCKVPFFFKQWGAYNSRGQLVGKGNSGRRLDGKTWSEMPATKDSKKELFELPKR